MLRFCTAPLLRRAAVGLLALVAAAHAHVTFKLPAQPGQTAAMFSSSTTGLGPGGFGAAAPTRPPVRPVMRPPPPHPRPKSCSPTACRASHPAGWLCGGPRGRSVALRLDAQPPHPRRPSRRWRSAAGRPIPEQQSVPAERAAQLRRLQHHRPAVHRPRRLLGHSPADPRHDAAASRFALLRPPPSPLLPLRGPPARPPQDCL